MAQVFLSYARGDAGKARLLASALEKAGHSVWWDRHLSGGEQFSKVIEDALQAAESVIVLWSKESVESPWVRDEAAVGRDTDRLVPVSLDGTLPPLGFRQFQTIDLSDWSGHGKIRGLGDILSGVGSKAGRTGPEPKAASDAPPRSPHSRWLPLAGGAAALLAIASLAFWKLNVSSLPTVQIVAADPSPASSAAANRLFVKLGSLGQVADGKWKLFDSNARAGRPDLLFKTSETASTNEASSNLLLLNGKDDTLLWSREFNLPSARDADLRQQVALTAGRVLECALEGRNEGHLSADLLKTFLDACASLADLSGEDYGPVTTQLRKVVQRVPQFEPAWTRLIRSEVTALEYSRFTPAFAQLRRQLQADSARARAHFPNLPELAVADVQLRDAIDYERDIEQLSGAIERAPANAVLYSYLTDAYLKVGRLRDAISSARKAAELDPLSPGGTTTYIMTLAHGGEIETAKSELKKAESLWAGTGALRDVQVAFNVRYGDPRIAMALDPGGYAAAAYYKARAEPSALNIAKFKAAVDEFRPKGVTPTQVGWAIQGLAQFGLVDDVFYWIGRLPDDQVASASYILFRPALASVRRDPRFMSLAKRMGLVAYWQKTGEWPDFCSRPGIPYDCKSEAAKAAKSSS